MITGQPVPATAAVSGHLVALIARLFSTLWTMTTVDPLLVLASATTARSVPGNYPSCLHTVGLVTDPTDEDGGRRDEETVSRRSQAADDAGLEVGAAVGWPPSTALRCHIWEPGNPEAHPDRLLGDVHMPRL